MGSLNLNVFSTRLHLRPAERHFISGETVCLRQLDLFPLQSLWQRHQGTHIAASDSYKTFSLELFGSDSWMFCCSANIQISIPVVSVTFIKKTKTALLVPNALVIETKSYQVGGRQIQTLITFIVLWHKLEVNCEQSVLQHVFVSFLSRNTTYKFLKSICIHLEVNTFG